MEKLSIRLARHVRDIYPPGAMKWDYDHGMVIQAVLLADPSAYDWAYAHYDPFIRPDGSIKGYWEGKFSLDAVNPGRNLFTFYRKSGEERFRKAADLLHDQLVNQPRTKNGVYWHKGIYPWQVWLDGLYMAQPFAAQYARFSGDREAFDDIVKQFRTVYEVMRDPETGLLYHAWDESRGMRWSDLKTGLSPHFWGRAMGWYCVALADVYELLPEDHPGRGTLRAILKSTADALLQYQDAESGMWYQILDEGKREGNYLETSCSAMFAFSLLKGHRLGMLPESLYQEKGLKAWKGIRDRFLGPDLVLGGIVKVGGLGGNPYRDGSFAYYISEPIHPDDWKGVGPFIFSTLEAERIDV